MNKLQRKKMNKGLIKIRRKYSRTPLAEAVKKLEENNDKEIKYFLQNHDGTSTELIQAIHDHRGTNTTSAELIDKLAIKEKLSPITSTKARKRVNVGKKSDGVTKPKSNYIVKHHKPALAGCFEKDDEGNKQVLSVTPKDGFALRCTSLQKVDN